MADLQLQRAIADMHLSHARKFAARQAPRRSSRLDRLSAPVEVLEAPPPRLLWRLVCWATVACFLVSGSLATASLVTLPAVARTLPANYTRISLSHVAHDIDLLLRPLARNVSDVLDCASLGSTLGIDPAYVQCPAGLRGVEVALVVCAALFMLGCAALMLCAPMHYADAASPTLWRGIACGTTALLPVLIALATVTRFTTESGAAPELAGYDFSITEVAQSVDVLLQPLARNMTGLLDCNALGVDPAYLVWCPTGLRGVEVACIAFSSALVLGCVLLVYRRLTRLREAARLVWEEAVDPEL